MSTSRHSGARRRMKRHVENGATMNATEVEKLKEEWTDQYVQADTSVPELARFRGMVGRVVTVNENGKAIVDFKDGPWYDIDLENLITVPKPEE